MRAISFDKLYMGDPTNETIGHRGIPCLCILGKPYNLGARPSELFSANLLRYFPCPKAFRKTKITLKHAVELGHSID